MLGSQVALWESQHQRQETHEHCDQVLHSRLTEIMVSIAVNNHDPVTKCAALVLCMTYCDRK